MIIILLLVHKYVFIIFRDDRNDRYGPPTRTNYRLIVENLSSRVSWQVRNHIDVDLYYIIIIYLDLFQFDVLK